MRIKALFLGTNETTSVTVMGVSVLTQACWRRVSLRVWCVTSVFDPSSSHAAGSGSGAPV